MFRLYVLIGIIVKLMSVKHLASDAKIIYIGMIVVRTFCLKLQFEITGLNTRSILADRSVATNFRCIFK